MSKRTGLSSLIVIIASLCASLTTAQAGDLASVKEKGVLRVALYQDFAPYSYIANGKVQGLDVAIAQALAEHIGVGMSIMKLTASDEAMEDDLRNAIWKGHYLGGGTADVMMHVPVDEAFAEDNDQVKIFAPYLREQIMIAHDHERIPTLNNLLIFTRNDIAVELDTIADIFLSRAENGRLVHRIKHYRYMAQACEALTSGAVPAFIAARAQLETCIKDDQRFTLSKVPAQVGLFAWIVGLAVKAEHEALYQALNTAMQTLRDDGTLEQIFVQHGLSYTPPAIR